MAELRVSELPTAATLGDSDLLLLSQPDANSDTGYASAKTTNVALATKVAKGTDFGDLQTTSKKLIGAINELKGEVGAQDLADLDDVNVTTPATGECLQYNGTSQKWENKDILAVNETTLTEPYVYKQVPNGKYTEKLKKIVGASVVWNQMVQNGNFADGTNNWSERQSGSMSVENGRLKITAQVQGNNNQVYQFFNIATNHIYFVSAKVQKGSGASGIRFGLYSGITNVTDATKLISTTETKTEYQFLLKATGEGNNFRFGQVSATAGDIMYIDDIYMTDITAEFNPTIADYAYTLGSGTEGAGVAWLQKYGFFTEEYYAYSTNTIQSVSLSGHKVVGFNQWDEITESGSISNTTGENISDSSRIRTKNFIPILPNTDYYISNSDNRTLGLRFYDENKNYLDSSGQSGNITLNYNNLPSGTRYLRFTINTTTYGNNICVNIFNSAENGTYKPYTEETTTLDHTELRGLFYLDNGELKVDGDIYNADGSEDVKYEERAYASGDESLPDTITDGTTTVTKKATPTTAALTPFNPLSVIESGGTEEFIDYKVSQGNRDVSIPCGNESVYGDNRLMAQIIKYINS